MIKKTQRKSGFTLIELLVVISIISLMSSIVFASVTSARVKGQIAYVQSQMRQYITALDIYKTNNDGYPPPANITQNYCLGRGPCMWGNNELTEDPALTTNLNQYITNTPTVVTGLVSVDWGFGLILRNKNANYLCAALKANGQCLFAQINWSLPVLDNPSACAPGKYSGQGIGGGEICIYTLSDQ